MYAILRVLTWTTGGIAAALALAILFWPLPHGIASVRVIKPDVVSAETRLIYSAGDRLTFRAARLLMMEDRRRDASRHVIHAALAARLALFTTEDQRSAFVAMNSYHGFGHRDLSAMTEACFAKRPTELSLAEAAELAVRERAPAKFARSDGQDELRTARDRLLRDLGERGLISPAQLESAVSVPLGQCS
jgi:penicillin-binding protein 1C